MSNYYFFSTGSRSVNRNLTLVTVKFIANISITQVFIGTINVGRKFVVQHRFLGRTAADRLFVCMTKLELKSQKLRLSVQ